MDYSDIIARKSIIHEPKGIDDGYEIQPCLMDFQRDIVKWALRRGRAAIFAACGSEMFTDEQVEFANGFHRVGEVTKIRCGIDTWATQHPN